MYYLLFITSPLISNTNILQLLDKFGQVSGLEVNMSKSTALNISTPPSLLDRLKKHFPFSWNDTVIPYLGIQLTNNMSQLYKFNYPPIYKKLKEDLDHWSLYKLSWLGRMNVVKMTLLPRILYPFRSLPIPITRVQLSNLHSTIILFIWGKTSHSFAKTVLFRPRKKGGLGLLNLWWYYQAGQLTQISTNNTRGSKPNWIGMAIPNFTIDFLLWRPPRSRPPILSLTLSHSVALCDSLHNRNLTSKWQPLAHIFHNPQFPPGMDIKAFQWWLDKGLYRIGHFFNFIWTS